ncbi:MAG: hypothetical protein ACNA8W_12890 [Bradymonadaceae bacterium]
MSQNTTRSGGDALRKRISEIITNEFKGLERGLVAGTLAALARDFADEGGDRSEGNLEGESSSGWTGRISSRVVRPLTPEGHEDEGHSVASITIEAVAPELVASLLYQTLQVGAVLVTLADPPQLNALVGVTLNFPSAHLSVQIRGRVVHVSHRGSAIEVSGISREDRAALQAMYDDYVSYMVADAPLMQNAPEGADEASSAPVSEPSVAPQTGPPQSPISHSDVEPDVANSALDGAIRPVSASDDDMTRSFAPFASRKVSPGATHQGMTTRRRVDLPDPDEHVITSTAKAKKLSSTTREFYGPERAWLVPTEGADRIETLADERIVDILLQLSEAGFTGLMQYDGPKHKRQLCFDGGYLVEVTRKPRQADEELGPMLQAADRITKRQLAMTAAHADEYDLTFERSLLELDILEAGKIRHAIAGRLTYLLREVLELNTGEVRIFAAASLSAGFLPSPPLRVHVAVERGIFERLFKRLGQLSATERQAMVANELDAYPEIVAQERDRLERAVTDDEQWRLLERVMHGRRRLREVFTESGLSSAETFSVVYGLHRMGLLHFDHSLHHTIVRERMRENVTVKYLSVHKASFFEVLNVHWSSYDEAVEKAYGDLIKQFDPTSVPEEMEPEVHTRVQEIRQRIESAYAALAKRPERHAYRMRIMPEYKLAHAIPLFLKQSELAERRHQWVEARDAIRRVLEIDPDHADAKRRLVQVEASLTKKSAGPADTNL